MKIEIGIPMPAKPRPKGRPAKYPFATMPVDTSFLIAATDKRPDPLQSYKSYVSKTNAKLAPKHFEIRQVEGGARIFRTK